ncbi:MAG: type III ribulose-bisphosphate carboxylase, partial [archaeon]
ESSVGTWTELSTQTKKNFEKFRPHIFEWNSKTGLAKIAYPPDLFEEGNLSQLMSGLCGNIFGVSMLRNLRLQDIDFPEDYIKSFRGPAFGIGGIRKLMKVKDRPFVGTIIKPKLGLGAQEHAKVAYNAWLGGLDFVKDDENLTSMKFNKFEDRIKATLKLRDRAEQETGEKKMYFANITAPYNEMVRRAKIVKRNGGEYVMIDVLTAGFSAVQQFREEDFGLVLHGHRAMHAAFTRNPKHGISMLVIAKLYRLAGLDQLHIGAIIGKMEGNAEEVETIEDNIEKRIVKENAGGHALAEDWAGMKPMLAVCSGGLHPGHVPELVKKLGNDIVMQFGGGVHGHPLGTIGGAKAARQAVDSVMKKIPIQEYAKYHRELDLSLQKFKGK